MKKFLLVAAAAVLGFAVWWILQEPNAAVDSSAAGRLDSAAEKADGNSSTALQQADAAGLPSSPSEGEQRAAVNENALRKLTVRVVRGDDPQPVQGATVYFLQNGDVSFEDLEESGLDRLDPRHVYRRFGRTGTTTADGTWQVDWNGEEGALFAEIAGLESDIETIDATAADVITLQLHESNAVRVRVVDLNGHNAADAPVSLRVSAAMSQDEEKLQLTLFTRRTGQDGLVEFADVSGTMAFNQDPNPDYFVRLEIPGMESNQVLVPAERDETIVLQLPDYGSMSIEAVDRTGARLIADGSVTLTSSLAHRDSHGGILDQMESIHLTTELKEGLATFPYVGLEKKLRVHVNIGDRGMDWRQVVQGPTVPGGHAAVQLLAPDAPIVRGRLLTPDGEAAVRRRGTLSILNNDGHQLTGLSFRTDADGNFLHQLSEELLDQECRLALTCSLGVGRNGFFQLPGSYFLENRDLDLGEMQLELAFDGFEGTCMDPDGTTLANITLAATRADGVQSFTTTNADGGFKFSGAFEQTTMLRLNRFGQDQWVLPEPLKVEVNGEAIEVVLYPAGKIAGTISIAEEHRKVELKVQAIATAGPNGVDPPAEARSYTTVFVDRKNGEFELQGLDPGVYKIQLLGPTWNELATIEGIRVDIGATASDPRIQPWRYQSEVHRAVFKLMDSDGRPALNAQATYFRNGKQVGRCQAEYDELRCEYIHPTETGILIQAYGFQPIWLAGTTGDATLTMERGILVTLACEPLSEQANLGGVHLALKWQNQAAGMEHLDPIDLSPDLLTTGECLITLPGPGIYQLQYRRWSQDNDGFTAITGYQAVKNAPRISVTAKDSGKTFTLAIPRSLFN